MNRTKFNSMKLERLKKCIDELREVLNEMCMTLDEKVNNEERLIVSQYLDELIVQYMKQVNNKEKPSLP